MENTTTTAANHNWDCHPRRARRCHSNTINLESSISCCGSMVDGVCISNTTTNNRDDCSSSDSSGTVHRAKANDTVQTKKISKHNKNAPGTAINKPLLISSLYDETVSSTQEESDGSSSNGNSSLEWNRPYVVPLRMASTVLYSSPSTNSNTNLIYHSDTQTNIATTRENNRTQLQQQQPLATIPFLSLNVDGSISPAESSSSSFSVESLSFVAAEQEKHSTAAKCHNTTNKSTVAEDNTLFTNGVNQGDPPLVVPKVQFELPQLWTGSDDRGKADTPTTMAASTSTTTSSSSSSHAPVLVDATAIPENEPTMNDGPGTIIPAIDDDLSWPPGPVRRSPVLLLAGNAVTTIPWHITIPTTTCVSGATHQSYSSGDVDIFPPSTTTMSTTPGSQTTRRNSSPLTHSDSNNENGAIAALSDFCAGSVATEHVTLQTEILDPTEPLFYGSSAWLDHCEHWMLFSNELKQAADVLYQLLCRHWEDPTGPETIHATVHWIEQYPDACQVRYPPLGVVVVPTSHDCIKPPNCESNNDTDKVPFAHYTASTTNAKASSNGSGAVYPLSYFCVTGCLPAVQAAYHAYPEAVGSADACLGLPLHYACHHGCNSRNNIDNSSSSSSVAAIVEFLVSTYPDAVRRTNDLHQTPLHLACGRNPPQPEVVAILLAAFPAAALTFDDQGFTPLLRICNFSSNYVCQKNDSNQALVHDNDREDATKVVLEVLRMLCQTSPLAVAAVTGTTMEKALHVAATAAADPAILRLLLSQDPGQCRYTDDAFQLPLHKAVYAYCKLFSNFPESESPPLLFSPSLPSPNRQTSGTSTKTFMTTTTRTSRPAPGVAARFHSQKPLLDSVALLVRAFPAGVHSTDANDERPYDIAFRMLGRPNMDLESAMPNHDLILQLLQAPTPRSKTT